MWAKNPHDTASLIHGLQLRDKHTNTNRYSLTYRLIQRVHPEMFPAHVGDGFRPHPRLSANAFRIKEACLLALPHDLFTVMTLRSALYAEGNDRPLLTRANTSHVL